MESIRILTLNMFLRPPGIHTNASDYKDLRTQILIEEVLNSFDLICLQEVFSTLSSRKGLIISEASKRGLLYSHSSPCPNPFNGHFTDGGLLILSRFPILLTDQITYEDSTGPDRLSSKGAIYAKLSINKTNFHIFTTHLQSSYSTPNYTQFMNYRQVRRKQLKQFKSFINNKVGLQYEPIIIAGDFNIDGKEELKPPLFELECQDDYKYFWRVMSDGGIEEIMDVVLSKYDEPLATFGILGADGKGIETVLTDKDDAGLDLCLDYILLMNFRMLVVDEDSIRVDPFYIKGQPVTQLSDHAGIRCTIRLLNPSY